MKIIEYKDEYLDDVKSLLTELGEYIVSIDKDNLEHYILNIMIKWP